jgi:hypothetical protein
MAFHAPNKWAFMSPKHLASTGIKFKAVGLASTHAATIFLSFPVAQQPKSGLDCLLLEVSRSHSVRHTTLGTTHLDEGSASRRDLWHHTNTHKRQTSMPPVRLEPTIPASARQQTYALDRAATGIGTNQWSAEVIIKLSVKKGRNENSYTTHKF